MPLFQQLTELEPQEGDHWLNLAACQKALKQMVAPLQTLQAAVALHPERPDLLQALGSALIEHGRWGEGLPFMQRSLTHNSSTDVQQFNLHFAAAGNRLLPADELAALAHPWETTRSLTRTTVERPHQRPLTGSSLTDRLPVAGLLYPSIAQDRCCKVQPPTRGGSRDRLRRNPGPAQPDLARRASLAGLGSEQRPGRRPPDCRAGN